MTLLNRGNLAANESPPPTGGVGPVGVIIIIVEEQVEGYGKEGRRVFEGVEGRGRVPRGFTHGDHLGIIVPPKVVLRVSSVVSSVVSRGAEGCVEDWCRDQGSGCRSTSTRSSAPPSRWTSDS